MAAVPEALVPIRFPWTTAEPVLDPRSAIAPMFRLPETRFRSARAETADRDAVGAREVDPVASVGKRSVARRVDADEGADDLDVGRGPGSRFRRRKPPITRPRTVIESAPSARPAEARCVDPRQDDLEHRVRPVRGRVDRGSRLRVAVDRDRVGERDRKARRRRRDRAHASRIAVRIGARNVELDRAVGTGVRVGVHDRLAERAGTGVVGIGEVVNVAAESVAASHQVDRPREAAQEKRGPGLHGELLLGTAEPVTKGGGVRREAERGARSSWWE